jgi:hypothetical protein
MSDSEIAASRMPATSAPTDWRNSFTAALDSSDSPSIASVPA